MAPRPAASVPPPPASSSAGVQVRQEYGAEADRESPPEVPSAGELLGELLYRVGWIEADFVHRWDAARLGDGKGAPEQAPPPGRPRHV